MRQEPATLKNARARLRRRGLSVRTEGEPRDWWRLDYDDRRYRIERNGGIVPGQTNLTLDDLLMIVANL